MCGVVFCSVVFFVGDVRHQIHWSWENSSRQQNRSAYRMAIHLWHWPKFFSIRENNTVVVIVKNIVKIDPQPWDHFYKSLEYNSVIVIVSLTPNHWWSPVVLQQSILRRIVFGGFNKTWLCFLLQEVYYLAYDSLLFQRDWPFCILFILCFFCCWCLHFVWCS